MTLLFSVATERFIIMMSDRAVTYSTNQEVIGYGTAQKIYCYDGIGCVSTWGELDGNNIILNLYYKGLSTKDLFVEELGILILDFLIEEYQADTPISGDIGYHIGGFDQQGRPRLYHIFWGVPRPNADEARQSYDLCDHSPSYTQPVQFLYNGRNDLADRIMEKLKVEIESGKMIFSVETPTSILCLAKCIASFAVEQTQEVSEPFDVFVIWPDNRIDKVDVTDVNCQQISTSLSTVVSELQAQLINLPESASPFIVPSGTGMRFASPYTAGTTTFACLSPEVTVVMNAMKE